MTEELQRVHIKFGVAVMHDHGFYRWPRCAEGPVDEKTVFTATWAGKGWMCRAPGFGQAGAYGSGAIFVMKDGIEIPGEQMTEEQQQRKEFESVADEIDLSLASCSVRNAAFRVWQAAQAPLLKRIEELSSKLAHYDHKCCEQKVLLKRAMEELADYMDEMTNDHAHVCCHIYGFDHANNCTANALHTDIQNHLEANNE